MKIDKSKYITGDKLIENLDKKIEDKGNILRVKLQQERKNFITKKELLYV